MSIDTLWYSYCPGPNAVGIASHLGWLADEFAPDDITVRTIASAPAPARLLRDAHQLVPRPEFPHILRHGGNPPALVALSKGVDLRIVGLTWTEAARRVLTLDGSGIRTPADLAGRRLSVPRRDGVAVDYLRSVTLRTYAEALASAGLTFAGVELVELAIGGSGLADREPRGELPYTTTIGDARSNASAHRDEALALVRGEIDALAAEHSRAAHLQATLGLHPVFDTAALDDPSRRANGDLPLVLTVTGALLDERPDIVARWLARSLDGAGWAVEHPVEARQFIASDAGVAEGLVDDAYSPDVLEQLTIDLDRRSIDGLRAQHDFLLAHGFLAGPVDIEAAIDPRPLAAARAGAVA